MSRVKTTARGYRLDCGCVTEFASLPAVANAAVLCGTCQKRTTISFRYPDAACGATARADKPGGGVTRVRCTLTKNHSDEHYDKSVDIYYKVPTPLKSAKNGKFR